MRLASSGGDELSLSIVGYQFPDAHDPRQRFSWNMVEGAAARGHERWRFRWPALTCDEPPLLAEWLRAVAAWAETRPSECNAVAPGDLTFTEPNLSFGVLYERDTAVAICVGLDLEFRAPSSPSTRAGNPMWLSMRLQPEDLRRAAEELDADITRYPNGLASQ